MLSVGAIRTKNVKNMLLCAPSAARVSRTRIARWSLAFALRRGCCAPPAPHAPRRAAPRAHGATTRRARVAARAHHAPLGRCGLFCSHTRVSHALSWPPLLAPSSRASVFAAISCWMPPSARSASTCWATASRTATPSGAHPAAAARAVTATHVFFAATAGPSGRGTHERESVQHAALTRAAAPDARAGRTAATRGTASSAAASSRSLVRARGSSGSRRAAH
jgi:hypothetical protein